MENEQALKIEEMGKERQDIQKKLSQMMDHLCPPIPYHDQIPSGQPSSQEQNLVVSTIDLLMISGLDDPYEQEKLKKRLIRKIE